MNYDRFKSFVIQKLTKSTTFSFNKLLDTSIFIKINQWTDEYISGKVLPLLQACPDSCLEHFNCVECVGFRQGPFSDKMCKERCKNIEIVDILYDDGN